MGKPQVSSSYGCEDMLKTIGALCLTSEARKGQVRLVPCPSQALPTLMSRVSQCADLIVAVCVTQALALCTCFPHVIGNTGDLLFSFRVGS